MLVLEKLVYWPRWAYRLLLAAGALGVLVVFISADMQLGSKPVESLPGEYWWGITLAAVSFLACFVSLHFLMPSISGLVFATTSAGVLLTTTLLCKSLNSGWNAQTLTSAMLFAIALLVRITLVRIKEVQARKDDVKREQTSG